jgi:predicted metal-dependent hydrolase
VSLWAPKLGLDAPRVVVSEPAKRWGSASADGTLRINWRVMQAPMTLVDYVLVHELTHLVRQHHGREFWATIGRVMPDYEARKRRLRELGPVLVW